MREIDWMIGFFCQGLSEVCPDVPYLICTGSLLRSYSRRELASQLGFLQKIGDTWLNTTVLSLTCR